jgi:hypothetical protein
MTTGPSRRNTDQCCCGKRLQPALLPNILYCFSEHSQYLPYILFTVFIQSLLHIRPAHCSSQQLLHEVVHYMFPLCAMMHAHCHGTYLNSQF